MTTPKPVDPIPATLIPGDGIGPEITEAVVAILDALGTPFAWDLQQGGMAAIAASGDPLPQSLLESIRRTHLAYEPADDGACDVAERGLSRCASQIGIERDERPVVVEHFLEMRNRPFGVDAVAAETAAEMIIDAAFGHPRERRANDGQRFRIVRHTECAQAEFELGRMREFGRTAEAAVHRVEAALQFGERHSRRAPR